LTTSGHHGRGYNIESLNVAPTDHPEISRLTLVTRGSDEVIEQINNQLLKLVGLTQPASRVIRLNRTDSIKVQICCSHFGNGMADIVPGSGIGKKHSCIRSKF